MLLKKFYSNYTKNPKKVNGRKSMTNFQKNGLKQDIVFLSLEVLRGAAGRKRGAFENYKLPK